VIQRRDGGKVNFSQNWENYKYGFGTVGEEFWIG